MDIVTLIIIAIGLSFDSFAVSVTCGIIQKKIIFLEAVKIAFLLAFIQGLMPMAGWLIGDQIKIYVETIDHWIAFILLSIIGAKMILDSRKKDAKDPINPLNFMVAFGMAIATSIDAFIVGISFAIISVNIYLAAIIIGSITFILSMLGMLFGKKTGEKFGSKIEVFGGIVLFLIGLKILLEHLFFQSS